jgi:hypothetical protein
MFSVDNFYDYLSVSYGFPEKNNIFYKFNNNGGRNLYSLSAITHDDRFLRKYCGAALLFDQEPFDLDLYQFDINTTRNLENHKIYEKYLTKLEMLQIYFSSLRPTLLCHSELYSNDIKNATDNGFIDVYYWYHGLIARDWFRHWKHYKVKNTNKKRFGIYIRDAGHYRSYRISILEKLSLINYNVHFEIQETLASQLSSDLRSTWPLATHAVNSDASATITWADTEKFNIHLVAETQFDTNKVHLTEKIFKPMVMRQPFILFAGPGSLKTLKKYGFKTFDSLWDESYDNIIDNSTRLESIISLINSLSELPELEFNQLLEKATDIVNYNHQHFYSQKFEDILLSELNDNFKNALQQQEDQYHSNPGGNWLSQVDQLYQKSGVVVNKEWINSVVATIPNSSTKTKILKKYSHLF